MLIDGLVVGGPQCPGQGVMVHQIQRCFTRDASTVVTLSGHAYGNEPWFVDDIFLVEVLDSDGTVLAALSTYQESNQVLGCCFNPPCTTSLEYAASGDAIQNLIQGGGNNGEIAAGAFDLTPYLPASGSFYLRFTGLDQGIEGALDRVFMNID